MTVEIRELIVQVEVTEPVTSGSSLPLTDHTEWDEQRWIKMIQQELREQLLERGC